jgi:hypothetical protein
MGNRATLHEEEGIYTAQRRSLTSDCRLSWSLLISHLLLPLTHTRTSIFPLPPTSSPYLLQKQLRGRNALPRSPLAPTRPRADKHRAGAH